MADSDSEYVLIVKDEFNNIESSNIEIYTVQEWFDMAEKGELVVYRCNSLKPRYVHKEYVSILPKFCILNIRNEVSAACHAIRNLLKCHFDQEQYALGKQILYRALQYVN